LCGMWVWGGGGGVFHPNHEFAVYRSNLCLQRWSSDGQVVNMHIHTLMFKLQYTAICLTRSVIFY